MNDYRLYTLEQLATDDWFCQWVTAPTPESDAFWSDWLRQNPDQADRIDKVRLLVQTVQARYGDNLSDDLVRQRVADLIDAASQSDRTPVKPLWSAGRTLWRVAAAVVLLFGAGWWFMQQQRVGDNGAVSVEQGIAMRERSNLADKPITVLLADGSVVRLEKNSTLRFPERFGAARRQVFLQGEAFFEVSKNPAKPFLVYANGTVTKVVGTSFRIQASEQAPTVLVAVRTGRVAVYSQKEYEQIADRPVSGEKSVLLTPNQQAVFTRKNEQLARTAIDQPELIAPVAPNLDWNWDDKPVADAFQQLKQTYGVDISFDRDVMKHCLITTSFTNETLPERLDIICQALGASYAVQNDKIVLSSKGCPLEE